MNIFLRELRAGLKAYLFWMAGMFALCYAGIVKFDSYTASGSMMEIVSAFPRMVLAVMGVVGVDMGTLEGYTALLFYYVLVCGVIYAVHAGSAAVTRESVDKTYEFIFTKPCSRARVLGVKLAAAYVYVLLFCIGSALFAILATGYLHGAADVTSEIWLCALTAFLVCALFTALAALLAALSRQPEKGTARGNLAFLCAFVLGVVCNILEKPGALRLVSPFSYFPASDQAALRFEPLYAALALGISAVCLLGAFLRFQRRDLL